MDWWHHQTSFFTLGLIFLFWAVVSTCTGVAPTRAGVARRDKDPRKFWWTVALIYLGAIFFFYCHLYGRPW